MEKKIVIDRLKRTTERRYPNMPYTIKEFKNFYSVVVNGTEPFLYEKGDGFPLRTTFAQISPSEKENSEIVYRSGGTNNGKK